MSGQKRVLGRWNAVRGCPGWYYSLRIQHGDGTVCFDVFNEETNQAIRDLCASAYRTTGLARRMGTRDKGYQHVAQEAIRALNRTQPGFPTTEESHG